MQYGNIINPVSYDAPGAVTSFSGADITAVAYVHGRLKVLGELQTITYSVHREKSAVTLLGRINPVSFTRGLRTIAGTLVFTVFNKEVLDELIDVYADDALDKGFSSILLDQIPPFDITIQFMNEDGYLSSLVIYGVEIVDEGQTMSINDLIIENIKSYKARDIDLMYRKDGGVWTPGRKFSPSAKFEALSPLRGSTISDEYKSALMKILHEIDKNKAEISKLEIENTALMLPGDINLFDSNELAIAKLGAANNVLTREMKEYLDALEALG